ncbi:hydroxyacid dehydrogenase [Parapusillimonas granuli]|uniref:Hydroxyacid dehydrogenase n=1 Tax=Parapusillimonas granuli TaxID=380911 RepID=A0A853FVQ0_9BURK|nr:hydroxyacid dehydrogenase [Parapusillimonas granuli]MBB5216111.1 (S)-sulfolactate dehydrogenase [Parapusillimonas granuli]MEB2400388.1 hydroxyacid dehydrogenase [Alcaligenaceae bacterium]NYT47792.1 hydroxyacid dehydrogenase [Parapusillimonas granuli]
MKIIISEFMDTAAVDQLRSGFEVVYDPALVDRPDDLRAAVAGAQGLIVRNRTQVGGELLAAAGGLKVVGRLGVGLDNIDTKVCTDRGIKVIPATGANSRAVAEYVIASAMMLLRGGFLASADVLRGDWPRTRLSEGRESGGKTLGLVGFGGIGRLAAGLAQGLGFTVIAYDPGIPGSAPVWAETGVRQLPLDELLAQSDVVSLHVPLIESTRNLFDADTLAKMRPGAILINTARGGIVDESALADALRAGRLGGAALDVFAQEPLKAGNAFADAPNLILTPHIAGVTAESNQRVSQMIADEVARFLKA